MTDVESRVSNLETKFEMFIQEMREFKTEMREFKTEMREKDNQRAEEIREIRQRQEAKFDSLDIKIENIGNHVRNLAVAVLVGVGAMVIAVILK